MGPEGPTTNYGLLAMMPLMATCCPYDDYVCSDWLCMYCCHVTILVLDHDATMNMCMMSAPVLPRCHAKCASLFWEHGPMLCSVRRLLLCMHHGQCTSLSAVSVHGHGQYKCASLFVVSMASYIVMVAVVSSTRQGHSAAQS